MFSKEFWKDAADGFLIAFATVLVVEADALMDVASFAQLGVVAVAIARAGFIAGLRATLPRLVAARKRDEVKYGRQDG